MLKSMVIHRNQKAVIVTLQILFLVLVMFNMQSEYTKLRPIYDEMYVRKIIYLESYSIINNIKINTKNYLTRIVYTNSFTNLTEIKEGFVLLIVSAINFYNNSLIDDNDIIIIKIETIKINVIISNYIGIFYKIIIRIYDTLGYALLIIPLEDRSIFIPR
ncbi:MAG: hypothetical protein ACP5GU_01315 [Thermoprotei archaeon]|jgi:hypothetical protein